MVMEARLRSKMTRITAPGAKIVHQAQRKAKTQSLKGGQNKYQSYRYEFQKNGACTRKGCRFLHFDPESVYPNRIGRHNNQRNYRDNQTPRPSPRRKTNNLNRNTRSSNHNGHKLSQRYNSYVCHKFQNTGSCPYGNRCKFRYIQQYKHNVINTNDLGPTVAFTGYPPQTQQPYQHVAEGQTVFSGPIGM